MNTGEGTTDDSVATMNEQRQMPPLQAEIQTAQAALKTALLQLGLLSRFQRDIRTLGVQDYAAKPPSNMTYALLQALKTYNEACDSMETQLMRAKAALLYDPSNDTRSSPEGFAMPTEHKEAGVVDSEGPLQQEQPLETATRAGPPEPLVLLQPPATSRAESTSLLNDDEMEDLFGPGTAKTDTSMISTPANAGSQQPQYDVSHAQSGEGQSAPVSASLSDPSATSNPLVQDFINPQASAALVTAPTQPFDPTASMFDFSQNDTSNTGALGLPDTNFDFSHMTSDDFNSLLATLGASSGGDSQGGLGNDLLQGLNLDTDLSSFLNTDINSNP